MSRPFSTQAQTLRSPAARLSRAVATGCSALTDVAGVTWVVFHLHCEHVAVCAAFAVHHDHACQERERFLALEPRLFIEVQQLQPIAGGITWLAVVPLCRVLLCKHTQSTTGKHSVQKAQVVCPTRSMLCVTAGDSTALQQVAGLACCLVSASRLGAGNAAGDLATQWG